MRYLLRPFDLWWRHFPQLAALYLLGWLGRKGAIELAAYVGWDNDVWASLIMPFAGLARLGSYIAMFLVLRSAVPALAALRANRRRLRQHHRPVLRHLPCMEAVRRGLARLRNRRTELPHR